MPAPRSSLAFGVAPSPAFSAMARRCKARGPSRGVGLSLAAFISVALWVAAGSFICMVIVGAANLAAGHHLA